MPTRDPRPSFHRALAAIGGLTIAAGATFAPPLAERLWALEPLHAEDRLPLWLLAIACTGLGLFLWRSRSAARGPLAALTVSLGALVGIELGVRVWLRAQPLEQQRDTILLARRTYHDLMAYQAHPFLQFTGRPGIALHGNEALGTLLPFNNRGFLGPAPAETLQKGTLRIACLGGSTTARGYPQRMQRLLSKREETPPLEVLNFGMGWYTSAHSTVNFVLNVADLEPDYVVFHHAWNDARTRNRATPARGDYSHALKAFEEPHIPDALLIRGSVLYRWATHQLFGEPDWAFLEHAAVKKGGYRNPPDYSDLTELIPYHNNLRTVVELSWARGIVPVVTTQPHIIDANQNPGLQVHIHQCNQVVNAMVKRWGDKVVFVDLDAMFTGKNDHFVDVGHMTPNAMDKKALAIGDAILEHWRANR